MKLIRQHMIAIFAAAAVIGGASSADAKPRESKRAHYAQVKVKSHYVPAAQSRVIQSRTMTRRGAPQFVRPISGPISRPVIVSAPGYGPVYQAQAAISPSKAKSIAAQRVKGAKFVDISRSGNTYRVRMLRKDGRVIDVIVDAATGRVLN